MAAFTLKINGQSHSIDVDPDTPLLWAIRDGAGLTGTKYGCGVAQCGACTVDIDGHSLALLFAAGVGGGPARNHHHRRPAEQGRPQPVQQAWAALDVPQCGYCQSGQMMSAAALLARNKTPERSRHRSGDERQHLPLRALTSASAPRSIRPRNRWRAEP